MRKNACRDPNFTARLSLELILFLGTCLLLIVSLEPNVTEQTL